jgi:hypothetical protein
MTALAADPAAMIAGNALAIDDELAPSAWDHMVWILVIWDRLVEGSGM